MGQALFLSLLPGQFFCLAEPITFFFFDFRKSGMSFPSSSRASCVGRGWRG